MTQTWHDRFLRIRRLREETQDSVAAAVGVNRTVISKLETDPEKDIELKLFFRLVDYYEVSLDWLYRGVGQPSFSHFEPTENAAQTEKERVLLQIWRKLHEPERSAIATVMEAMVDSSAA